jgi:hypothetical protein
MEPKVFSRKELYEMVWQIPVKQITVDYMVSFYSFKKICNDNKIPLPPNGYWSKKKYGKESPPTPLPIQDLQEEKITLYKRKKGDQRDLGALSDFDKLKLEIENDPNANLEVPKRLPRKLDPILLATKSPHAVNYPVKDGIRDFTKRYDYGGINISVSDNLLPKTLRLVHTLVQALKARGHTFSFVHYHSYVVISGIEIALRFREKHKRVKNLDDYTWNSTKFESLGLVTLITGEYYQKKEWNETKTISLEKKLPQIIAYLEITAKNEFNWKIESDKREKVRKEQEKIEMQKAEIRGLEIKKLNDLIALSRQWHEVQKLRKFLTHLDKESTIKNTFIPEIKELIKFGKEKADWLDPTIVKKDEILEGVDPHDFF